MTNLYLRGATVLEPILYSAALIVILNINSSPACTGILSKLGSVVDVSKSTLELNLFCVSELVLNVIVEEPEVVCIVNSSFQEPFVPSVHVNETTTWLSIVTSDGGDGSFSCLYHLM